MRGPAVLIGALAMFVAASVEAGAPAPMRIFIASDSTAQD